MRGDEVRHAAEMLHQQLVGICDQRGHLLIEPAEYYISRLEVEVRRCLGGGGRLETARIAIVDFDGGNSLATLRTLMDLPPGTGHGWHWRGGKWSKVQPK